MCRKEQVFVYHHAKGGVMPKLDFGSMGFPPEVAKQMDGYSLYGKSVRYAGL